MCVPVHVNFIIKIKILVCLRKKLTLQQKKTELCCLLFHYAFLLSVFPMSVWFPAMFLSGLLSALIVTPTHQNEEMFIEHVPDWVSAQFLSTRNAVTTDRFSEWM